jgi:hypothetical protein
MRQSWVNVVVSECAATISTLRNLDVVEESTTRRNSIVPDVAVLIGEFGFWLMRGVERG